MSTTLRDDIIGRSILLEAFKKHARQKMADRLLRRISTFLRAKLRVTANLHTTGPRQRILKAVSVRWHNSCQRLEATMNRVVIHELKWLLQTAHQVLPGLPLKGSESAAQHRLWKTPIMGMMLHVWTDQLLSKFQEAVNNSIKLMVRASAGDTDVLTNGVLSALPKYCSSFGQLASTAIGYAVSAAREEFFQANRGLIKSLQLIGLIDLNSQAECQQLNHKLVDVSTPIRPPFHFGCRMMTVPLFKGWRELGYQKHELPLETREELDQPFKLKLSYSEWLSQQSPELCDIVLGKRQSKRYADGKLNVAGFDGKFLKPISWERLLELYQL